MTSNKEFSNWQIKALEHFNLNENVEDLSEVEGSYFDFAKVIEKHYLNINQNIIKDVIMNISNSEFLIDHYAIFGNKEQKERWEEEYNKCVLLQKKITEL